MNQGDEISVLHVDDEPDFADLTAEFLERENERISVQTATSADEGLKHLAESEIDCIVSDYQMPGRNGIEFLETVREEHPNLPFILYTGKGSEEVASQAISSGVTDYLQKETGTDDYTLLANRIANGVESQRHEQRLEFLETIKNELIELSIDFLRTEERDIDALIDEGLETIGGLVEADRSYVFEIDHEAETLSNTHEWCGEGIDAQIDRLQDLPLDTFSWWMQKLENFENIEIPNVSELPPEAETEQEILQEQNIASLIVTPVISNGELVGFIGFDWVTEQEPWSDEFIDILRMASELITTARRREARRRELERHEAYLEHAQDSITVVDEDGTVQYQSDSVEGTTGYRSPEILGESGFEYVHPADRQKVTELFTSILGNPGETATAELRVETKDGLWRWIEAHGVNKLDDPMIDGIVTSARDITEQKERERELERMSDLFEQAQEIADLGAWETDLRNDEGWWTEQVNRIYGLPSGYEPNPGEGIEYFHPEDQPVIRDAFERATEEGEPYDLELRVGEGDETPTWVRTRGKPQVEEGEVVGVRGTIQEITERKEREAELQQERSRLNALFQHSTDAAVFTEFIDGDPIVRDVNAAFETTFGYEEESAVGRPIDELVVPDESDKIQEATQLNRRIETGELVETEVRRQAANGFRDFLLQSIPLEPGESGTRTYAIYSDITERKERERKLQRERDRLDRFASVVSHDLRNPLSVATGQLDLAMDECESDHLEPIAESLDRMGTLIEDVLSLARAGESVGEMDPVELAELGQSCWHHVETKSGELLIDTDAVIRADKSRLQQLVENLFRNAVEHGGDEVTVTVGKLDDGFYMEDDGTGIPEAERDEVFDPGYSSREEETGVGLSIVKGIVEAHDWEIRVSEGTDGGARFEITGVEFVAD